MRDLIELIESKSKPSDLEIVKLSYSDSQLSPVMGSNTIKNHLKLWKAYCDRYNDKEGDPNFNYAGHVLHTLFFTQFRVSRQNNVPNGPIGNLILSKFKSFDKFKDKMEDAAKNFTGSGWIYLSRDGTIKTIQNHQIKQDILILIDLWEHAFQLDYGSDKKKYLANIWKIMDWSMLNARWAAPYRDK